MENIPLVDLQTQHSSLKKELQEVFERCLAEGSFIGGPEHHAFENEFAEFCGGGAVALCGNGTDALYLTIREAVGPANPGEEIITVANTFIATTEAISQAGYKPVFVDVNPRTYLMEPLRLEKAITAKTKAIIPVHLYGQMAPMEAIMQVAKRHNLIVIEDAAQAHGAKWNAHGPGTLSDAATFSFYPGKNLGALGDGGAVYSTNHELVKRVRMRANHGRTAKYEHDFEGMNSRLDGIQAGFLRVKLKRLSQWNEMRRRVASWYREELRGFSGIILPMEDPQATHVYHLFICEVDGRDRVMKHLASKGIGAGVHYPIPLHKQKAYSSLGISDNDLPVTSRAASRILSLPIFPEMTRDQVRFVVQQLAVVLNGDG